MNDQIVVWIPFGDLMHHEDKVGGPHWNSGPGNQEWWLKRAVLLERYTLRSLSRQEFKNFSVWVGIANETPKGYANPVGEVLERYVATGGNAQVHQHDATETFNRGQSVPQSGIRKMFELYKRPVTVVWLDSDDMLHSSALKQLSSITRPEGGVFIWRRGYLWDTLTKNLYYYDPAGVPPPFFARYYSQHAMDDLSAYEKCWNFTCYHHQLFSCPGRVDLDGLKYCVTTHRSNTSTGMTNGRTLDKIKALVAAEDKPRVMQEFGL